MPLNFGRPIELILVFAEQDTVASKLGDWGRWGNDLHKQFSAIHIIAGGPSSFKAACPCYPQGYRLTRAVTAHLNDTQELIIYD